MYHVICHVSRDNRRLHVIPVSYRQCAQHSLITLSSLNTQACQGQAGALPVMQP